MEVEVKIHLLDSPTNYVVFALLPLFHQRVNFFFFSFFFLFNSRDFVCIDEDHVRCVELTSHGEVSFLSYSIFLDLVIENGEKSRAKLQRAHEFHLSNLMH